MAEKVITKEDLAEQLAKDGRMTKADALKAVEFIFAKIAEGLNNPEYGKVKVAGFGAFTLAQRPARVGVNPSNPNEKIKIPASKAVKFKPSKTLKDLVNAK
jgi:DNA-binding protein HU-beta